MFVSAVWCMIIIHENSLLICLYMHEKGNDLHLRGDFRDRSHAVVL